MINCINPIPLKIQATKAEKPQWIMVGCGRCPLCLQKKSAQWIFRLKAEAKFASDCSFITLTYSDEHLPGPFDNGLKNIQKFIKRFRKNLNLGPDSRFKYFLISELGGVFGRLHYHAIFFNTGLSPLELHKQLDKFWPFGINRTYPVIDQRIAYVAKYCMQDFSRPRPQYRVIDGEEYKITTPSFYINPHSNGLGLAFLTPDMMLYLLTKCDGTIIENGYKKQLPSYYLEKVYGADTSLYDKVKRLRRRAAVEAYEESVQMWNDFYKEHDREAIANGALPLQVQEIQNRCSNLQKRLKSKYNFQRPPIYEHIYENIYPETAPIGVRFEPRSEIDNRFWKTHPRDV